MKTYPAHFNPNKKSNFPWLLFLNPEQISRERFKDRLDVEQERSVQLLKDDAERGMLNGTIPNLRMVCYDLLKTFTVRNYPFNALQFVSELRNARISEDELRRFLQNKTTNHVLVENSLIKIVLIHWKPGMVSSIHGHPDGGCVFKVLKGRVKEKRYTPDSKQKLLSTSSIEEGSLAYIHNALAHHAVGNPFSKSSVTLHAYTPGP